MSVLHVSYSMPRNITSQDTLLTRLLRPGHVRHGEDGLIPIDECHISLLCRLARSIKVLLLEGILEACAMQRGPAPGDAGILAFGAY